MTIIVPPPKPSSISSDDESDIGIRREYKRMKGRLAELERLYATGARNRVPTATSVQQPPLGAKCEFHLHVIVNTHSAEVTCSDCGAPLEPLQVLREFATEERQFAQNLEHLRREKAELHKEIEALKKQRLAMRAKVRKAGGRPLERWEIPEGEERPQDSENGGKE